ncbi:hypothetical protein [Variovorax beijingensis]|uniref:hypothetical protein n=1 Tax=Variovorax beijingensis TaxID=2496117 RepID=UPI003F69CAF4
MNALHCTIASMLALLIPVATAGATVEQQQTPGAQPATAFETGQDPLQQIPHTLKALDAAKAGEYGKLRSEDQQRLNAADRDIQALTQGDRDLHTLNEQERTRLFNAQETIMAIVSGLKRSQLVCSYRQNVGTRFRTKQCVTRDMAEAQRRAARDAAASIQNHSCFEGEPGGCGNPLPTGAVP